MSETFRGHYQDVMHEIRPDFPENISLSMAARWLRFKTKTLELRGTKKHIFLQQNAFWDTSLVLEVFPCGEYFRELFLL